MESTIVVIFIPHFFEEQLCLKNKVRNPVNKKKSKEIGIKGSEFGQTSITYYF